jgi:hypothetical protein
MKGSSICSGGIIKWFSAQDGQRHANRFGPDPKRVVQPV